jgi:hypothetical protein
MTPITYFCSVSHKQHRLSCHSYISLQDRQHYFSSSIPFPHCIFQSASAMAFKIIEEISRLDLDELQAPSSALITDIKHLSSYNWIEEPTPTIVVPGSPALWSAPKTPRQVKKDSGLIYIAQNAARHPDSPLEPLFRALYVAHPSFNIHSTDVVTDRNNIRKLLSFVSGRTRTGSHQVGWGVPEVPNAAQRWKDSQLHRSLARQKWWDSCSNDYSICQEGWYERGC